MNITDSFSKFCHPIDEKIDIIKLNESIAELLIRLGTSVQEFVGRLNNNTAATINLTNMPGLEGRERWEKWAGNHQSNTAAGISEVNFTERLLEMEGLYIGEVFDILGATHLASFGTPFTGRCQIICSRPQYCYKIHNDKHTPHRYHIPVFTNENVLWLFEDTPRNINIVHMPADGRIWYLNPVDVKHTLINIGGGNRMHLLFTSGI